MRIYLDVCCYNRPFDDQTQDRIRLETEAVAAILARADHGEWELVGSTVHQMEVREMPDSERKSRVFRLLPPPERCMLLGDKHRERAAVLTGWGLKIVDALHVACAEALRADVLLTTDDRLSAAANRPGTELQVRVANPLSWLEENV